MSRNRGGRIRIIAGALRGSRIDVPDRDGLRPTSDRVRETLFNWLAPWIEGARALDLFAGTGALGLEALSRGAASVEFVEQDRVLVEQLRANLSRLKQQATVHGGGAEAFLRTARGPYDLVFLDPPFAGAFWSETARQLESGRHLQEQTLIYVESPRLEIPVLPVNWALHRELLAGEVRAALYRRMSPVG